MRNINLVLKNFYCNSRNNLGITFPILILAGIYSGWFTAMEAASITAVYVFIVEVFIYKDLNFKTDLPRITKESMVWLVQF